MGPMDKGGNVEPKMILRNGANLPQNPHDCGSAGDGRRTAYSNTKLSKMSEKRVHESLKAVMLLLRPALEANEHDEAMIALALSSADFVQPLSWNEVTVLACALYRAHLQRTFDYNDVLELTHRFRGRAMNTTTVYNTVKGLHARGLIEERERELDEKTERISQTFAINAIGQEAFRFAVLAAHQLKSCPEPVAA